MENPTRRLAHDVRELTGTIAGDEGEDEEEAKEVTIDAAASPKVGLRPDRICTMTTENQMRESEEKMIEGGILVTTSEAHFKIS